MSMRRWEPFSELMSLRQAMDRLLEDSFVRPSRLIGLFGEGGQLPIDMYQTASDLVIKTTLPGVKPEDVEVTISGDTLTIKGETRVEEEVEREDYLYQERRYGSFSRTVTLPCSLQTDKAEAAFENGVITLTIPRAEEAKPRLIKIKPKGTIEGK